MNAPTHQFRDRRGCHDDDSPANTRQWRELRRALILLVLFGSLLGWNIRERVINHRTEKAQALLRKSQIALEATQTNLLSRLWGNLNPITNCMTNIIFGMNATNLLVNTSNRIILRFWVPQVPIEPEKEDPLRLWIPEDQRDPRPNAAAIDRQRWKLL